MNDPLTVPGSGRAVVGLGCNLPFDGLQGDELLAAAVDRLRKEGLRLLAISRFRQTVAWPDPSDPPYTNGVAVFNALGKSAQDVLSILLATERAFGRVRSRRNAPRTLDLDLLDFEGTVVDEAALTLPHPRIAERMFVLEPLAEIWPDWRHPRSRRTATELLAALPQ